MRSGKPSARSVQESPAGNEIVKRTFRTIAISLAVFVHCVAAQADESTGQLIRREAPKGITAAFFACIDKASSDRIAIAACHSAEQAKQDARLNKTYKALLARLGAREKESLVGAQRTWLELQTRSSVFEEVLYGDEPISGMQVKLNGIFRLCERANMLEKYLSIAKDQ